MAHTYGYRLIGEFYDAAVSGADPVTERPGLMLVERTLLASPQGSA